MQEKDRLPIKFPTAPFGMMGMEDAMFDPYGAYTGVAEDKLEKSVQDVDDL